MFAAISLDRSSAVPLHEQIYRELRRLIMAAHLSQEEMLPREVDLATQLQVSRGTVRQAVARLVRDGLVYRTSGRGTFVKVRRSDYPLSQLVGFTEQMLAEGRRPSSDVVAVAETDVRGAPAGATFPPGVQRLLRIDRVRRADGEPVAFEELHLPFPRFAGLRDLDLNAVSVYSVLEQQFAVSLGGGSFLLDVSRLDARVAGLLCEPPGAPVFVMNGTVTDDRGATVLAVTSRYRPAHISFRLHLPRHGGIEQDGSRFQLVPR
ncbi:GntR family transcriptional regulator [Streptomyces sp. NPDC050560]|uniref:GntR family transcriptional regulator n=1 Tax=Streptomyces sp. NPDC050560 TaxID=3365630 RepID=UPI0037B9085D